MKKQKQSKKLLAEAGFISCIVFVLKESAGALVGFFAVNLWTKFWAKKKTDGADTDQVES